jgi:muramidase (phage lysozyme)
VELALLRWSATLSSTAAGRYQFLKRTWDNCVRALGLTDFSAHSQDLGAVYLILKRGALNEVLQGRIAEALYLCRKEWASLAGAGYGQN